jgi:uncharacterized membrane protein
VRVAHGDELGDLGQAMLTGLVPFIMICLSWFAFGLRTLVVRRG